MTSRSLVPFVALALVVSTEACSRKQVSTQPGPVSVPWVEPAPPLPPPPAPPPPAEEAHPLVETDVWSGDLHALNAHLRDRNLLSDVHFAYDSHDLSDAARERLAQHVRLLQDRPELVIAVEGHCDERGSPEYNLALGDRRAASALGYLVMLGVDRDRIRAVSYGKEQPQCREGNESCWQLNRRAHFLVVERRAEPGSETASPPAKSF